MADWHPIQASFEMGEVSSRMGMRQDLPLYAAGLLKMVNYYPTPQGTAVRVPGTRFAQDVEYAPALAGVPHEARCIGFEDAEGEQRLLLIRPDLPLRVISLADAIEPAIAANSGTDNINLLADRNFSFVEREKFWTTGPVQSSVLFVTNENVNQATMQSCSVSLRSTTFLAHYLRQQVDITNGIDGVSVNVGMFLTTITESENARSDLMGMRVTFSTTDAFDGDLGATEAINFPQGRLNSVNTRLIQSVGFTTPLDPAATLYISVELYTPYPIGQPGEAEFRSGSASITEVAIFAAQDAPPIVDENLDPLLVYGVDEVKDIQYVQSPYGRTNQGRAITRNELVLVHPNHPPRWVFQDDTGAFTVEDIPFVLEDPENPTDPAPLYLPPQWGLVGNYPASCTAYQGRLILGGGGTNGEEIIGSVVGDWNNLWNISIGAVDPETVFPSAALLFKTTFRSPIKWMSGQQDLLVGTSELEYKVTSTDGILRPGDIDARVQTTQGSVGVQPVGVGDAVLFAADRGSKARRLVFRRDNDSYVAPDMTLFNPFICASVIRRIIRIRNPHQMALFLLNNGEIVVLHYDVTGTGDSQVFGWSRMQFDGTVIDFTVLKSTAGDDVPILLIDRRNELGEQQLKLETIPGWRSTEEFTEYSDSFIEFVGLTTPADGITPQAVSAPHLAGRVVEVINDNGFQGYFQCDDTGKVVLADSDGYPIPSSVARVGIPKESIMKLLPPAVDTQTTGGIGAKKRYKEIGLRLRNSRVPFINGVRPPNRDASTSMSRATPLNGVTDDLFNVSVSQLGIDEFQTITISETVPERVEIVGVFGDLTSNKT